MVEALTAYLEAQRAFVVRGLRGPEKVEKLNRDELDGLLAAFPDDERKQLLDELLPYLEDVAASGVEIGLDVLTTKPADFAALMDQANDEAIGWAERRAADLVGMRVLDDGSVVPNPNVQWQIDETTRKGIRDMVAQAERDGLSNDDLADKLEESFLFSPERAEMIARTETAFADVEGNVIGWKASGVVAEKEWAAAADCCDECQELDGQTVPLDDEFPEGDPPLHPNCRCDLLPVLTEESEDGA